MDAGNMLAKAHKTFSGQGEYVANQLVDEPTPIPSFVASPDGSTIRISHKEYIGDVFAPDSNDVFQNTAYSINPGIERTFPWLSQIAANYDEYTIHQLMFSYRSTVADFASASGQVGQVIMATIYNAASEPFSDKAQMMQYDSSMSCKTSESMIHGVECDPAKISGPLGRFVRVNPTLTGQDINQYDHGLFNVAVTETPSTYANQAMGELWISYTIELRKPKFFTNRGLAISRDIFACSATGTGINSQSPFGQVGLNVLLTGQQNNIGGSLAVYDGSAIPAGLPGLCYDENNNLNPVSSGSEILAFAYTLPANYAGYLRISFRCTNSSGPGPSALQAHAQGNITIVRDVLGDGSDNWVSGATGNVGSRVSTQWFDIRVETATNGIDNTVYFTVGNTVPPAVLTTNAFLDIVEYNHGLSYKQDGSRDQIILVDTTGTLVNL